MPCLRRASLLCRPSDCASLIRVGHVQLGVLVGIDSHGVDCGRSRSWKLPAGTDARAKQFNTTTMAQAVPDFIPRAYQQEIFQKAQEGNVVCASDTGSGKVDQLTKIASQEHWR